MTAGQRSHRSVLASVSSVRRTVRSVRGTVRSVRRTIRAARDSVAAVASQLRRTRERFLWRALPHGRDRDQSGRRFVLGPRERLISIEGRPEFRTLPNE